MVNYATYIQKVAKAGSIDRKGQMFVYKGTKKTICRFLH